MLTATSVAVSSGVYLRAACRGRGRAALLVDGIGSTPCGAFLPPPPTADRPLSFSVLHPAADAAVASGFCRRPRRVAASRSASLSSVASSALDSRLPSNRSPRWPPSVRIRRLERFRIPGPTTSTVGTLRRVVVVPFSVGPKPCGVGLGNGPSTSGSHGKAAPAFALEPPEPALSELALFRRWLWLAPSSRPVGCSGDSELFGLRRRGRRLLFELPSGPVVLC